MCVDQPDNQAVEEEYNRLGDDLYSVTEIDKEKQELSGEHLCRGNSFAHDIPFSQVEAHWSKQEPEGGAG